MMLNGKSTSPHSTLSLRSYFRWPHRNGMSGKDDDDKAYRCQCRGTSSAASRRRVSFAVLVFSVLLIAALITWFELQDWTDQDFLPSADSMAAQQAAAADNLPAAPAFKFPTPDRTDADMTIKANAAAAVVQPVPEREREAEAAGGDLDQAEQQRDEAEEGAAETPAAGEAAAADPAAAAAAADGDPPAEEDDHDKTDEEVLKQTEKLSLQQPEAAAASSLNSSEPTFIIRRIPAPDGSVPETMEWVRRHALFFLHVPKTAGQSFTRLIRILAKPYQNLTGKSRGASPPRLDLTFMQRQTVVNLVLPDRRPSFTNMFGKEMSAVGHADILIAEAYEHSGRTVEFITILRNPVERVYSHFCYVLRNSKSIRNERRGLLALNRHSNVFPSWISFLNNSQADVLSTESLRHFFLGNAADRFDNWHTRAYAGCLHTVVRAAGKQPELCRSPEAMLAEAKRQLQGFLFLGLTEHYNETVRLLQYTLQYDPARYDYVINSNEFRGRMDRVHRANISRPVLPGRLQPPQLPQPLRPPQQQQPRPPHGRQLLQVRATHPISRYRRGMPGLQGGGGGSEGTFSRAVNVNREKAYCMDSITQSGKLKRELDLEIGRVETLDLELYKFAADIFWKRVAALPKQPTPAAAAEGRD